ncbi:MULTISPECIES: hypothetical protein [Pseudomonas]|uniref:hypothetical protein n=1 Tax=Pseudomonas TaxID=286 RepID=UPI00159D32E3|nr:MULTISPECIES: hypothetical protein [Pseudomonas]WHH49929.1 hypothetical protein QFA96_18300 [Pseudomonas sp. Ap32]MBP2271872.1 hypothetical protein [Pseudomonas sp. BP6]MBP2289157.1 hypothetical protein [Pseudomonas sp. BP7]HDS1695231.1 hypothetical protein [Pseudomonas putida]HDS1700401.1 hypothetical protein [Pseudomonas putida]
MSQTYPNAAQKAHVRICEQVEAFLQHGGRIQQVAIGVTGYSEGVSRAQWKKGRTVKP